MTDAAAAPAEEPSIEEILASIRKIISDEPTPGGEAANEPVAAANDAVPDLPPPPPAQPAAVAMPSEDDILDLGEFAEAAPDAEPAPAPVADNSVFDLGLEDSHNAESMSTDVDIDSIMAAAAFAPATPPVAVPDVAPAAPLSPNEPLISAPIADAAIAAFSKLTHAADAEPAATQLWVGSRTIEQVVEDLLRPMLKSWLDGNLPKLVERLVEKELARMARRAVE